MAEIPQPKTKRPTCPTCSKPSWLCLCARIKNKKLDNSIAVTVLQHSLETKHPLNSARILLLGLKNVTLSTLSDVNFEAQFDIRLFKSESQVCFPSRDIAHQMFVKSPKEKKPGFVGDNDKCEVVNDQKPQFDIDNLTSKKVLITARIGKQGVINNLSHVWANQNRPEKPKFETFSEIQSACDVLAKGFVVQKLVARQRVEFEIGIPHGSVLLFPSEEAIGVDEVKDVGFEVKNLIVLDGTWAKAKRMYAENPWLKLLPHLKLEVDRASLYEGVRMQPKVGCLSTIESVVYALKALGCDDENADGLNELLGVFESMVCDQRECKEKRLRLMALNSI